MERFQVFEGTLYRDDMPLRENYARHVSRIETGADLRACLRAGPYAWPGGYPVYFFTSDGSALSFDAVRDNLSSVIWSIRNQVCDDWRVIGLDVCYGDGSPEDPETVWCDHTGEPIS